MARRTTLLERIEYALTIAQFAHGMGPEDAALCRAVLDEELAKLRQVAGDEAYPAAATRIRPSSFAN